MLSSILILVAGFIFAESEILHGYICNKRFWKKPFQLGKWYLSNNWTYKNELVQFLFKYILAFAKDGFHVTKSIAICLMILSLSQPIVENIFYNLLINYIIFGVGFNIRYHWR